MNYQTVRTFAFALLITALSGCLANPPDTTTGETQAASLIFNDFDQIAQQILSDRLKLVSIIDDSYDPNEVQKHDYYWLFPNNALKIIKNNDTEDANSWYVIHQQTNDTIRFRETESKSWIAKFSKTRINDSQFSGQIELLTDTLELPLGDPAYNQAMNVEGEAYNQNRGNTQYDIHYTFHALQTIHAVKTDSGYELCVGEIKFEVYFPNKAQPKDRFTAELYIEGTTTSREYKWSGQSNETH